MILPVIHILIWFWLVVARFHSQMAFLRPLTVTPTQSWANPEVFISFLALYSLQQRSSMHCIHRRYKMTLDETCIIGWGNKYHRGKGYFSHYVCLKREQILAVNSPVFSKTEELRGQVNNFWSTHTGMFSWLIYIIVLSWLISSEGY